MSSIDLTKNKSKSWKALEDNGWNWKTINSNYCIPYWYGSNPYVFPMGTPMMLINTNAMVTLLMPIWNLMTYSMMGGVHPLVPAIQVPVIIFCSNQPIDNNCATTNISGSYSWKWWWTKQPTNFTTRPNVGGGVVL